MSWLRRLFRLPHHPPGGDLEGWQVGDLAECILTGGWLRVPALTPDDGPAFGVVLKVATVRLVFDPCAGALVLALGFAAWPDSLFNARAFRKLRPRPDAAIPAETAFTARLRRLDAPVQPTKEPA